VGPITFVAACMHWDIHPNLPALQKSPTLPPPYCSDRLRDVRISLSRQGISADFWPWHKTCDDSPSAQLLKVNAEVLRVKLPRRAKS